MRHETRTNQGILLIRLTLALFLFSILSLKILDGLAETRRLANLATRTDTAVLALQNEMEWIRAQGPHTLPLGEGQPFASGLALPAEISNATGTLDVIEESPGLLHVRIALIYTWKARPRRLSVESLIADLGKKEDEPE